MGQGGNVTLLFYNDFNFQSIDLPAEPHYKQQKVPKEGFYSENYYGSTNKHFNSLLKNHLFLRVNILIIQNNSFPL